MDIDAVYRPGTDTPYSPTALEDLEIGGLAGDPILLDDEKNKENYPPATPVYERPRQPQALLRS